MPTQQRPDMVVGNRFQGVGPPGRPPLENNLRRHVLILPRNNKEHGTGGVFDRNACVRFAQCRARLIAPMPEGQQRAGIVGIRHRCPRRMQARIPLPRNNRFPCPQRQPFIPGRRRKGIDQHQRVRIGGAHRRQQASQAGACDQARTLHCMQRPPYLRRIVPQRRCVQPLRTGLQVDRLHSDGVGFEYATPPVPFPGAATGTMDQQGIPITQPRSLPG